MKTIHQKVKNLVNRIAELPSSISAVPMYERISELQRQIEEKEKGILRLEKAKGSFTAGDVTERGLKAIEPTIPLFLGLEQIVRDFDKSDSKSYLSVHGRRSSDN